MDKAPLNERRDGGARRRGREGEEGDESSGITPAISAPERLRPIHCARTDTLDSGETLTVSESISSRTIPVGSCAHVCLVSRATAGSATGTVLCVHSTTGCRVSGLCHQCKTEKRTWTTRHAEMSRERAYSNVPLDTPYTIDRRYLRYRRTLARVAVGCVRPGTRVTLSAPPPEQTPRPSPSLSGPSLTLRRATAFILSLPVPLLSCSPGLRASAGSLPAPSLPPSLTFWGGGRASSAS